MELGYDHRRGKNGTGNTVKMKTIDRYIFTEFMKKFLLFYMALNIFLFCADTHTNLEQFLKHHIPFGSILRHCIAQSAIYLPLILPLTFVMVLIFIFVTMCRHNEITLLLSSGISFFKATRILWFCGGIGSINLLWGNFYWIPKAQEYSNHYWECFETNGEEQALKHLTLVTKDRLWYINRYDRRSGCASGIAVHEYGLGGLECRRIAAQSGHFNGVDRTWILERGCEILFHPQRQTAEEMHVFERRAFPELDNPPAVMLLLQSPLQNLSLPQLREAIEIQKEIGEDGAYKMRFGDLILSSFLCFLSCWVALPVLFAAFGKNYWRGVIELGALLLTHGTLSYTLYALGVSGAIHWSYALCIPFCFLLLMPLLWFRKSCQCRQLLRS
jgi:lipopolysaccharide export LptBFGC system permease protein LptF